MSYGIRFDASLSRLIAPGDYFIGRQCFLDSWMGVQIKLFVGGAIHLSNNPIGTNGSMGSRYKTLIMGDHNKADIG
jgi:hypothetical protein